MQKAQHYQQNSSLFTSETLPVQFCLQAKCCQCNSVYKCIPNLDMTISVSGCYFLQCRLLSNMAALVRLLWSRDLPMRIKPNSRNSIITLSSSPCNSKQHSICSSLCRFRDYISVTLCWCQWSCECCGNQNIEQVEHFVNSDYCKPRFCDEQSLVNIVHAS